MSEKETLARVAEDLAAGRRPLARQRLRGLVGALPQRLDLREQLAELYRADGDLAQAGRYSYLAEQRDPAEVAAFERAYQEDPVRMMKALGWRGPEADAATETARGRLRALRSRAEAQLGVPVDWEMPRHGPPAGSTRGDRIVEAGCTLIAIVVILLVIAGLISAGIHGFHVVADRLT